MFFGTWSQFLLSVMFLVAIHMNKDQQVFDLYHTEPSDGRTTTLIFREMSCGDSGRQIIYFYISSTYNYNAKCP